MKIARQCAYANCDQSSTRQKKKRFFKFPINDRDRLKKWIKNCGKVIASMDFTQLRNKYICEDHFVNADIIPTSRTRKNRGLCKNAVPMKCFLEEHEDQVLAHKKQKDTLILLKNIYQELHDKKLVSIARGYKLSRSINLYTKQEVVEDFIEYHANRLLAKGVMFSTFNEGHLKQAIALFRLFYYAKNYEVFNKTAIWARQYVNEGLFIYSYLVALVHRPDTQYVIIPPIHEINPYYFFHDDVIHKAQREKVTQGPFLEIEPTRTQQESSYPEQSLTYYLEDVGILAYYFYFNVYYPFWMKAEEYGFENVSRGELYYFFHQQFLTRYYLERLTNNLGCIPSINWDLPIKAPFHPLTEYRNGRSFPDRPSKIHLTRYNYNNAQSLSLHKPDVSSYTYVNDYERRVNDHIDTGFIINASNQTIDIYNHKNGLDILGNVIQSNCDSPNPRFYGPMWLFASRLLGRSDPILEKSENAPSILEHFETAPRDPMFYQIYQKISQQFQRFYKNLSPYKKEDIIFEGIKIDRVICNANLFTMYAHIYSDISNAIYYTPEELKQKNEYIVRQKHLRCKPFRIEIVANSDKKTRSVVKTFLGPKYDEYEHELNFEENRLNMLLLDYFVVDLKIGENIIIRHSEDTHLYRYDSIPFFQLYNKFVMGSNETFSPCRNYFSFPARCMLPRGSKHGNAYKLFVIIYPYKPKDVELSKTKWAYFYPGVENKQFHDSYSLGYPFDRCITSEKLWSKIPNAHTRNVKIHHLGDII